MRKQVKLQQIDDESTLVTVHNIFSFLLSTVQSKIKKHSGQWNFYSHRYQVPLAEMPALVKEIQQIGSNIFVQPIPPKVSEIVRYYGNMEKPKKQLIVDSYFHNRFQYTEKNLIESIFTNFKGVNYLDKILIMAPNIKIQQWIGHLSQKFKCHELDFKEGSLETVKKQNGVWLCSYENIWSNSTSLYRYNFQVVICDDAELLASRLLEENDQNSRCVNCYLVGKKFLFFILAKKFLNQVDFIYPLLTLIKPKYDISWFRRRYKKENCQEFDYVLTKCSMMKTLDPVEYENISKHYLHKIVLKPTDGCIEKLRTLNKKYGKVDHKKVLESPQTSKLKAEKQYLESVHEILQKEKSAFIGEHLCYLCKTLSTKVMMVIETIGMYKMVQKLACQNQISYCHFEHSKSVMEFNSSPETKLCLVMMGHLLKSNPQQVKNDLLHQVDEKVANEDPEAYLCIASTRNVIFPDPLWTADIVKREKALKKCLQYVYTDITRHYYIFKETYEEKWMELLKQSIIKQQINDLSDQSEQLLENSEEDLEQFDKVLIQEETENVQLLNNLKDINLIEDVDQEYDNIEFQALKQKQQRKKRKKEKRQKRESKRKEIQKEISDKSEQFLEKSQEVLAQNRQTIVKQEIRGEVLPNFSKKINFSPLKETQIKQTKKVSVPKEVIKLDEDESEESSQSHQNQADQSKKRKENPQSRPKLELIVLLEKNKWINLND